MRGAPIEVSGEKDAVVKVDKFMKSVNIFKCNGEKGSPGKIEVQGKCNSVQLENCSMIHLYVDTVMSTVEISNCKNVKLFVKEEASVLAVVIDKSDGCHIILNKVSGENPDFQVVAAKSSEMTLTVEVDGEKIEKPIPEQFVFKVDTSSGAPKIISSVSDIYAH